MKIKTNKIQYQKKFDKISSFKLNNWYLILKSFLCIKVFESISKELMNRMIYVAKLVILIYYSKLNKQNSFRK
jgi:hypothetical protein